MDSPLTRAEHNEFVKRMEDEHTRINHRVAELETVVKKINDLTISISEMSTSMKQMIEELRNQGGRLEELESRDGEMWRKVVGHVITCVAGIVISYLFFQIGM